MSDRHWPAPRRLRYTLATSPRSRSEKSRLSAERYRAGAAVLWSLLLQPRYEGPSALGCCTGLPWRSMLTPTRTAGTAQTIQLAL